MGAPERARRRWIGGGLAAGLIVAWLAAHVAGVFFWRWTPLGIAAAVPLVLLQTWLGAGLFIVAHDAMHGSLLPGWPRGNTLLGQLAVGLYAGFDYQALRAFHHRHHAAPGTGIDPDFFDAAPGRFWPWYLSFFRTYFGWAELLRLSAALLVYLFVFHAPALNMGVFWGLPAILSSLQLFAFGTWLPHRRGEAAFSDHHRARTIDHGRVYTLLTCFHFGLHHEHHAAPHEPWWRLPAVREGASG